MSEEQTITIDGKDYKASELSDGAKNMINNLRACDAELARQKALVSMLQAARVKYVELLQAELPSTE